MVNRRQTNFSVGYEMTIVLFPSLTKSNLRMYVLPDNENSITGSEAGSPGYFLALSASRANQSRNSHKLVILHLY